MCLVFAAPTPTVQAQTTFPQYDHVFLLVMESESFKAIIGNQDAPILNALANDYGLATNYSGVGDPSEPNYVGMLGGDTFGLSTDDPYWFPGQTVNASNLMTQLERRVQHAGAGFPNQALIEHWDGTSWTVVTSPPDTSASALPLGVTATATSLTLVGEQETDAAPYSNYVAAGAPTALTIQATPTMGAGENDPFAVTIANDGTTWVVGWAINPGTDLHDPLVLQGVNGVFFLVSVPNPSSGGDSGFAAITTVPGGGMWAVGGTATAKSNVSTLIEFHP